MIDNIKFRLTEKTVIGKLLLHSDFTPTSSKHNSISKYKHSDKKIGAKLRFEFKRYFERGQFSGYDFADIVISPHYHFNEYKHNGNDLTPENSIKSIIDILTYLKIKPNELGFLKVINIEFGLNIIPEINTKILINGLLFYKRKTFIVPDLKLPFSKKSDTSTYKQIKAYAKGLQFMDYPEYNIHPNTFRFEVKSKEAKNITTYKINIATDLLHLETYYRLGQIILDEWENVMITNLEPDLDNLNPDEVEFIKNAKRFDFWDEMYTVQFARSKEKYDTLLGAKNNLQHIIKLKIIDKTFSLLNVTFSTQKTTMNKEKVQFIKNCSPLINLENVTNPQSNRFCMTTGIDISSQQQRSKFLREKKLKFIKDYLPDVYKTLERKYLKAGNQKESEQRQLYLICKNIKDADSNPRNNRKSFEKRNYPKNQLQFNFNY